MDQNITKVAIVAGATGLIGSNLIKQLFVSGTYDSIICLVRNRVDWLDELAESNEESNTDLEQLEVEYQSIESYGDKIFYTGLSAHTMFICLGTTLKKAGSEKNFRKVDLEYPLRLAQMAQMYGCRRLLLITALGADSKSNIFYNRIKGELEDWIRKIPIANIDIFRPSLLLGERNEFRLAEEAGKLVSGFITPILIGPLLKYRPIEAHDVAYAMTNAARRDSSGIHIWENDEMVAASLTD